nr:hypothetical transcript [Hymenolepis microstoma]
MVERIQCLRSSLVHPAPTFVPMPIGALVLTAKTEYLSFFSKSVKTQDQLPIEKRIASILSVGDLSSRVCR